MYKCDKCNIEINSKNNRCPLCKHQTKKIKDSKEIYPFIPSLYLNTKLTLKILTFISLIGAIFSLFINYIISSNFNWANFVILGIITFWLVILFSMKKGEVFIKRFINYYILFVFLFLGWDYFINFHKWSVNYAIPLLTIIYLLFIFVISILNRTQVKKYILNIYVSLFFAFIPLLSYYLKWLNIFFLSYIATLLNIGLIIFITIFYYSILKEEMVKKFHF